MTEPDTTRPPENDAAADQPMEFRSALPFVLAGMVAVAALYGVFKWWQVEQAELERQQAVQTTFSLPPVEDFELTERSGEVFRSSDMEGKVWAVSFFFSTCPGSCIRLNQNIKLLQDMPDLAGVTWVSITCDPDTDTVEVLEEYADRWGADPERWLFCTGDMEYIKQVGLGMHLDVYRRGHKDYVIVFDKTGKIRGMFDATRKSQAKRLHTLLLECLKEEPTTKEPAAEPIAASESQPATT